MYCAWQAYLDLLPVWLRDQVDKAGKDTLQELRLRVGRRPELVRKEGCLLLNRIITEDDLQKCVNIASQYSPWTSSTLKDGYITAQGGHRIGVCGELSVVNGKVSTVSTITSLCMRVARDIPDIAAKISLLSGSILIIGSPGRGKTTLLRDLIRQKSDSLGSAIAVVDERKELFPVVRGAFCFSPGQRTDVLSGCGKAAGIDILIRTMNPVYIAVDEITAVEDCRAIIGAIGCGVDILATAHAEDIFDYMSRPVYKQLRESGLFQHIVVMQPDKSWKLERMNI